MNKGLEVIEAHELFGVAYDRIDVVVHPQSVVHSMVELVDGATIAQLSMPDMRLPIGYALGWPERLGTAFGAIDWSARWPLTFEPPDRAVFACLDLAYRAGRPGGAAPAWLNAANEVAVAAFLDGRLGWLGIADVVAETLDACDRRPHGLGGRRAGGRPPGPGAGRGGRRTPAGGGMSTVRDPLGRRHRRRADPAGPDPGRPSGRGRPTRVRSTAWALVRLGAGGGGRGRGRLPRCSAWGRC